MNRRRMIDRRPVAITVRYARARSRQARAVLALAPRWRWWRAPLCWLFGHAWPKDGPVLLSEQLCHCQRCGEEFDARTR